MSEMIRKRKADDLELEVEPEATVQELSNENSNISVPSSSGANATTGSTFGGGFSAYAKTNPFAAATANLKPSFGGGFGGGFGSGFGSSGGFGSGGGFGGGFGTAAISISTAPATTAATPVVTSSLTISTSTPSTQMPSQLSSAGRQNFSMPPPLVVPSPKSPKLNPFSSPSPVHNPFMTIVESKDELWKTMAKDKLSDEEAAKSSALLSGVNNSNKKSRLASYGGGSSYFGDSGYYPSSFGQNDQAEAEEEGKNEDNKDSNNDGNNNNDEDDNDDQEGDDNNNNQQDQPSPGKMYTTYALPENVIVVTGEEQDECLLQLRVKLYRLGVKETGKSKKKGDEEEEKKEEVKIDITAAEWIEVGIGPLKVLRQKEDEVAATEDSNNTDIGKQCSSSSSRLVMRREDKKGGIGTKLLLNVRLNQFVSIAKQGDKMIRVVCINYADPVLGTTNTNKDTQLQSYLIKTKTTKEFEDLFSFMEESIESAKKQVSSSSQPSKDSTTDSVHSSTGSETQ